MAQRRLVENVRRRRRREEEPEAEEGGGLERWLISYADMVTLLLVMFIILFSMSSVDVVKYEELKSGLSSGFGVATSILTGDKSVLSGGQSSTPGDTQLDGAASGTAPDAVINTGGETPQQITQVKEQVQQQVQHLMSQMTQRTAAEAKAQVLDLVALWNKIEKVLKAQGLEGDVQASIDERGLVISLVSRHIVFPYNLATLTPRGQEIVDTIAPVLAAISEPIEVDGHTNQEKVKPKLFKSDWDLAFARADAVLERLRHTGGLPDRRLQAASFGHTKPLVDPSLPEAKVLNKRVDIVVKSQEPGETRDLYAQEAKELHVSVLGGTS